MGALNEVHKTIDESGWDAGNAHEINQLYSDANSKLNDAQDGDGLAHLIIEQQAFALHKSPDKLSSKVAGERLLEDGSTEAFEWPDISTFSDQEFHYLLERFRASGNRFTRTEFGLVLFYCNRLPIDDTVSLVQDLFQLAHSYYEKADDTNNYIVYLRFVLSNLLNVASSRKSHDKINESYAAAIRFILRIHQESSESKKAPLRIALDLTDFAVDYFSDFSKVVSVENFELRNWHFAKQLEVSNTWGSIYISDVSMRLCRKLGKDTRAWLFYKAQQFERLALEAESQGNLSAVSFVEKAMELYKALKDDDNRRRLEAKYQSIRGNFELGAVEIPVPEDEGKRNFEQILRTVNEGSERDIILTLVYTPMIASLGLIRETAEQTFQKNFLSSLLPVSIQDSNGNTIANYVTDDERRRFSFIRTYEFQFQQASQTLVFLFFESFNAGKLTVNGLISFLRESWIGDPDTVKLNGRSATIDHLSIIESSVKNFFQELEMWKSDNKYIPNVIAATDSMVLKVEYLLRTIALKLSIPTFKVNPKDTSIIMEKRFDELLSALEPHLSEDDHYFIKFVLSEKAGYNLRNRIAHGLMASVDYSPEYTILTLIIILKLSAYQFTSINNERNEPVEENNHPH